MRLLLNNTLATAGLVILVLIVLDALAAPLLPLPDPDVDGPANRLHLPLSRRPSARHRRARPRHPLAPGLGQPRVSLAVGVSATLIAAFFGSLIGLVAGYAGGRVDSLLMRGIDMVMAFPYILLALAIVAVLGPGLINALYAIAIVNIPFFARNIRGITLGLSRREFVDAARLSGKSNAADPVRRDPAQRPAGDHHHHVDHHRLDDPGDRRPLLPRARRPAAAGRSRLDARRRAQDPVHRAACLDHSRPDDLRRW